MLKHVAVPVLMVATLSLISTSACSGKGHTGKGEAGTVSELVTNATVPIDQAIKTALEAAPGTAVEAELEKKHDKTVWEVEVLGTDGHMTEVRIDAETGTVIDSETKHDKKETH